MDLREAVAEGNITVVGNHISIPRLIQVAVILITLIFAGWTIYELVTRYEASQPKHMSLGINIAFPKFQVTGENVDKDELEILQRRYDIALEDIATTLDENLHINLGDDSSEGTHEKLIEINTPRESGKAFIHNHEDAVRFAESINADIVIYGTIEVLSPNTALIQPKIYIAPHTILDEGTEISGSYLLGKEVFISNLKAGNFIGTNDENLEDRLQALIDVSIGLNYYMEGDFEKAILAFDKALKNEGWENPDLIYLLLGNAALKFKQFEVAANYYEAANTAYQAASQDYGSNYPRALIGQGSVAYMLARGGAEKKAIEIIDPTEFETALELYTEALESSNHFIEEFPVVNVDVKARFGLGQTYLLKAFIEQHQGMEHIAIYDYAAAAEQFNLIIEKYEGTEADNRTQLAELSGLAFANLGLIEFQQSNFATSAKYYAQSLKIMEESEWHCTDPIIELRKNSEEKMLYLYVEKLNDSASAITRLTHMSENPDSYCGNNEFQKWYEEKLKSIQQYPQIGEMNDSASLV